VDPVPDPLLFFLVVPGIEPGPRTLMIRPQRWSRDNLTDIIIIIIIIIIITITPWPESACYYFPLFAFSLKFKQKLLILRSDTET
jgi:hypothetical protein